MDKRFTTRSKFTEISPGRPAIICLFRICHDNCNLWIEISFDDTIEPFAVIADDLFNRMRTRERLFQLCLVRSA
jgi:hypothetical protein